MKAIPGKSHFWDRVKWCRNPLGARYVRDAQLFLIQSSWLWIVGICGHYADSSQITCYLLEGNPIRGPHHPHDVDRQYLRNAGLLFWDATRGAL